MAVVTNAAGSVTSAVAALTVLAPPSITAHPQSRTNVSGTSATFSVVATGTAPLNYQWQRTGENISGATGTSLSLSNVQAGDAGSYSVVVTNTAGSVTSAVAVLTVWIPPSISAQPQSRTNIAGTTAVFSVLAGGTTPLTYQWQLNGGSLAGATGPTLALNSVQAGDTGNYSVVVTNGAGSVTSSLATLTVWVPPGVAAQPQSRTNVVGTAGAFSVTATGTTPLNYQWQFNGANIANATSSLLSLTNIQISDAGNYSVIVTNVAGVATSAVAVLTILTPPLITTHPHNSTNVLGTTAEFSASASGSAPLNYQWQFNGANIAGANDPVLILGDVQVRNAGNYGVIVTNMAGATTSTVATLTVLLPPTFTVQPRSHTNVAFVTSAFSAAANGTPPFGYQWRFNGENIPGASDSTLIVNNPQLRDSGNYTVVVTNVAAAATSTVATLTVIPPTDCIAAPAGLVGWWSGEGNANDIAGTNNGSLQGGALASVVGVVGSGVGFDGANGFVQIPDAPALKPPNLTVICWVRFDSLDSAGNTPSLGQQFIVFKQNSRASSFEGFLLSKERVAGRDIFSWTVTAVTGQSVRLDSTETIVPGVWYHVGAVRGPDFIQLCVNGQLEAVTNVSFPQDYGNFPMYFGSSGQPSFDRKLAGVLDEVSLCNRALSASEITADYFAGINGKCKAPKFVTQPFDTVGYWGGTISFSSAATGALPLKYQWRKNGFAVPNATNSFLLLSNLQLNDVGNYALQATNSFGSGSSDSAQLKVYVADVGIRQSTMAGTQNVAALSISGVTGRLYGVQVSPSIGASNHWSGLTNIMLTTPTVAWFDPQSATQAQRYYRIVPGPIPIWDGTWETADVGVVWSDDFNRAALGSNWVILGTANVSITNNELQFAQINTDFSRQVYYLPWLTSSDEWTIRWTQRFGALDATSYGVGVGIKNFQAAGGNDRGYNGLLLGAGPDVGKMQISRFDGGGQQPAGGGNAISIAPGNIIDCSLTRSAWTMTATASNRANAQVSTSSLVYSEVSNLIAPTISRVCFYPLGGTVYMDNLSFTINHRKPARFIVLGASASDGYNASSAARRYISVVQSNFFEAVCNDSSSYNTTTNAISIMPEILAHQPTTAILMIGGNDLAFGYPSSQWQTQYSNLVAQLQMNGIVVKHTFQTPRNSVDLRPLKDWITSRYPPGDIIDTWTPFVTNAYSLRPIYDSGDGVHPNDAGHLLLGQIIRTNLP
jgi:lysophospholipase L1-like esterase